MNSQTITLGIFGLAFSLYAWRVFYSGAKKILSTITRGQKTEKNIWKPVFPRLKNLIIEVFLHLRMLKKPTSGFSHWLVMVGFLGGFLIWFESYGQTFDPEFHWPLIGNTNFWLVFEEILGVATIVGAVILIIIRKTENRKKNQKKSRFYGSNKIAAYFVEIVVLAEGLGILLVKTLKIASGIENPPLWTSLFTKNLAIIFNGVTTTSVSYMAFIKLLSGLIWLAVVGKNVTWGVAWHRFLAFINIYTKKNPQPNPALKGLKPATSNGKSLTLENIDFEKDNIGVGKAEDFTWKALLDFSSCTECGRCQNVCPAWNSKKPLSPKLLVNALRDNAYLNQFNDLTVDDSHKSVSPLTLLEKEQKLVGFSGEENSGVISFEELWDCTTCGACVEQCPVDIEHVDTIVDLRRHQVLTESNFPKELAGMFNNLEAKGNPWGQNKNDRTNWIDEIDIEIPIFGEDADNFEGFEYLFWVGCAGAYEDKAKKTTKAIAELLDVAGVNFLVLGNGETCTGDPARRAGNEFLFQTLAEKNIKNIASVFENTSKEKQKIIVSCAHCFNSFQNEYSQLGAEYQVVHHTQLLNQLVREKRLTLMPKKQNKKITYHDPCYIGRYNNIYEPPRELLDQSTVRVVEMDKNRESAFCCGAGGARMWLEDKTGQPINTNRAQQAVDTNAEIIATGCPFCGVMLDDGLNKLKNKDIAPGTNVEVKDVAQILLESVDSSSKIKKKNSVRYLGNIQKNQNSLKVNKVATMLEDDKKISAEKSRKPVPKNNLTIKRPTKRPKKSEE